MRAFTCVLLAGCAASSSSVPATRFVNAPVVEAVNDRSDVPKKPQSRILVAQINQFDGSFFRRVTRGLEVRGHERSLGVNAFDEVPDSTWFTNRIGRRTITPEELRAAPGGVGSPEPHKPWTIISSKVGGLSDGFIIKDARGEKFILKFDMRGKPETESATHVIVGKLLW